MRRNERQAVQIYDDLVLGFVILVSDIQRGISRNTIVIFSRTSSKSTQLVLLVSIDSNSASTI